MKKLALIIVGLAGMGCGLAEAGQGNPVTEATADGSLTIEAACQTTLSLDNRDARMRADKVEYGAEFTGGSIASTCPGRLWVGPAAADEDGFGILAGDDGKNARYSVTGAGAGSWEWEGGAGSRTLVTTESVAAGSPAKFVLYLDATADGSLLPVAGHRYTYTLQGGHYIE